MWKMCPLLFYIVPFHGKRLLKEVNYKTYAWHIIYFHFHKLKFSIMLHILNLNYNSQKMYVYYWWESYWLCDWMGLKFSKKLNESKWFFLFGFFIFVVFVVRYPYSIFFLSQETSNFQNKYFEIVDLSAQEVFKLDIDHATNFTLIIKCPTLEKGIYNNI